MLESLESRRPSPVCTVPARQQGVVLMVALIILVAMTLAGVALIRSVDTANVIAGNLAFHESATHAGDRSTEVALVNWLAPNSVPGVTTLYNPAQGYFASRADPAAGVSWDAFWNSTLAAKAVAASPAGATCANAQPDVAGDTVCYVIHRLCATTGKPNTAANPCTQPPPSVSSGGSQSAGAVAPAANKQVYYRITTRIEGPRRTVNYVQTVIAL